LQVDSFKEERSITNKTSPMWYLELERVLKVMVLLLRVTDSITLKSLFLLVSRSYWIIELTYYQVN